MIPSETRHTTQYNTPQEGDLRLTRMNTLLIVHAVLKTSPQMPQKATVHSWYTHTDTHYLSDSPPPIANLSITGIVPLPFLYKAGTNYHLKMA